jgi:hypothetical protein
VGTALGYFDRIVHEPVNQTIKVVNSAAPVTGFVFQRLRLADAFVIALLNALEELVDPS